jgi:predicted pyridoxine 5'-phosphate oxidase superfamily flavin-nucleotide-binding protein
MLDTLAPRVIEFVGRQTQMIIATADPDEHPDASVRFGEAGFVVALDDRTLARPELRGQSTIVAAPVMAADHPDIANRPPDDRRNGG